MPDLHIGAHDAEPIIELLPSNSSLFRDGDSWHEWGEPRREGAAEHLVIRASDSADLLADVAWLIGNGVTLVPMDEPAFQRGVIACITPSDDWSEPTYTLLDVQHQRGQGRG